MNIPLRDEHIQSVVNERYEYLVNKGYNVVAVFLQGSQNYELDIYTKEYQSDIDVKAIVVPTLDNIVLNKQPVSTTIVLDNNEHIEVKDIRVMKEMFIKENISYIELLYTKFMKINPQYEEYVKRLIEMRDDIVNININQFYRCIVGMSKEKYKALEHPYPTIKDKIDKYGYDPKQLHHIVRLNRFMYQYAILNKPIEECYIPQNEEKEELIKIKLGKYSLEEARNLAKQVDLNTYLMKTDLIKTEDNPNQETIEKLNKLVCDIIKCSLKEELMQ